MSANLSAMNLHLTGQSVHEGYNNCMLASRFAMIILRRLAGTTVPAGLWQHLCVAFLVKFPTVR